MTHEWPSTSTKPTKKLKRLVKARTVRSHTLSSYITVPVLPARYDYRTKRTAMMVPMSLVIQNWIGLGRLKTNRIDFRTKNNFFEVVHVREVLFSATNFAFSSTTWKAKCNEYSAYIGLRNRTYVTGKYNC